MAAIKPYEIEPRAVHQPPPTPQPTGRPGTVSGDSFGEALAAEGMTWSRHARQRLASRHVNLSAADLARIAEGVDRAAAKGARDSLVLLNELALIVNVRNRTVLTALDSHRLSEGVVTNIDSTVFV
jgi:flagellar operon protein